MEGPGARQSFEVNGWRKSLEEVAAFYFTALPDSYAARTGRPQNVGVIGVAVFREQQLPRPPAVTRPRESNESRARDDAQGEREADAAGNSAPAPASPPSAEASADAAKRAA